MPRAFQLPDLSLRQRLVLGMLLITLPLLVISALGYVMFIHAIDSQDEMYHEVRDELLPVMHLRSLLLKVQMPANDFLIHGNVRERENFSALAREVDAAFATAFALDFHLPEKRRVLREAMSLWQEGRQLCETILALPDPVGHVQGAELMERMDALLERAFDDLTRVADLAMMEVAEQQGTAHQLHSRAGILIAVMFCFALAIVVLGVISLRNWIIAPLAAVRAGAERVGGGELGYRIPVHSEDEIGHVAMAFNRMAEALRHDHARLHNLATQDSLTGLLNVREFHQRLRQELERSERNGHPCALLMLDIDQFKSVNDRFGHPAGDCVIREIAVRIGDSLRPADIAGRYGGEEFIVLLPETEVRGAHALAERLRAYLHSRPFDIGDGIRLDITASLGVACYPAHSRRLEELVAAADHALYAAKRAGRNRVCIALDTDPPV